MPQFNSTPPTAPSIRTTLLRPLLCAVAGATLAVGSLSVHPAAGHSAAVAPSAKVPARPGAATLLPDRLALPASTTTGALTRSIRSKLRSRIKGVALGSDASIRVTDLESGQRIFSRRAKDSQIPASTMKLATAAAVLGTHNTADLLTTKVTRTGKRARNIVLVGGGDPVLTSSDVDELARATATRLKSQGLPAGPLRIRYDASLFAAPKLPGGWPSSYVRVYSAWPRALMRDRRLVPDGPQDTARYFRQRLRAHGLRGHLARHVRPRTSGPGATLMAQTSHMVGDALWRMLRYSDNTVAEVMIRHVALARGLPTTTKGAPSAVRAELKRLGVPLRGARFVDGSGLSRWNRLPARTLVGVVRASMDPRDPDMSSPYRWDSIPIAGRTGTLHRRYSTDGTECAVGLIMAKTGTLSGVVTLAGVAAGKDGRARAFAVAVNNRPARQSLTRTRNQVDRLATTVTGCR